VVIQFLIYEGPGFILFMVDYPDGDYLWSSSVALPLRFIQEIFRIVVKSDAMSRTKHAVQKCHTSDAKDFEMARIF
jgi:hypothetical protein